MMSYILNNAHYTQMLSDLSEGSTDGVDSDDKPSQSHSAALKTIGHGNPKVTETKKGPIADKHNCPQSESSCVGSTIGDTTKSVDDNQIQSEFDVTL